MLFTPFPFTHFYFFLYFFFFFSFKARQAGGPMAFTLLLLFGVSGRWRELV